MATSAGTQRPPITRLGIVLTVFLLATPLAVAAQQASDKIPLIGALDYSAPDAARLNWWKALRQALQELGYVEGRSIRFEARWAQGRSERLPGLAAELVRLRIDILVTGGGESARAVKKATATIPIVMATRADPVRLGLVESLGRPGGNVTGVTSLSTELIAKRVELLRRASPEDLAGGRPFGRDAELPDVGPGGGGRGPFTRDRDSSDRRCRSE